MCFADADPAEEDDVAVLGDEVEAEQVLDLGPVDLLRPTPVEAVEGLAGGQAGVFEPARDERVVAAGDLAGDEVFEVLGIRPLLARGLGGEVGAVLGEVRQLQAGQML